MSIFGQLEKMKLTAYSDAKYSTKGKSYTVMINPEKIEWDGKNNHSDCCSSAIGTSKKSAKYKNSTQGWSFEITIDCTGIIDKTRIDLDKELKDLKEVVYTYKSSSHQPNYVIVKWGSKMNLKGKLTDMEVNRTFFRPDGKAVRAKVKLKFESSTDPETAAKEQDNQSPDMTHLIHIKEGDSLPHLSHNMYGSSEQYIKLAHFNNLNKFRRLKPNSQMIFPPLIRGGS